eukprot:1873654-Rhodomonas_salina.1
MQDFKFQAGAVHVSCELESTEAAAETESPVLAQPPTACPVVGARLDHEAALDNPQLDTIRKRPKSTVRICCLSLTFKKILACEGG